MLTYSVFLFLFFWIVVITTKKLQEVNARLEAELAEMELAPVQRKIEARSSDDSFTGLVRILYFADTFLSDSESPNSPCDLNTQKCLFLYPPLFL